tara:strand:- start:32 stop:1207 length:1176 start_codon:yes stop_codon:yes gene_type:complete
MNKSYYSLGLMSGTSGDGIDASIIKSDGQSKYEPVLDKYFEYDSDIPKKISQIKDKLSYLESSIGGPDYIKIQKELYKETNFLEKKITLLHAEATNEILKDFKENLDFIGFHGQTIQHLPNRKRTWQLGDGNLLSNLTKRTVVYDFRQNDVENGGEGAPLTPIFHKLLVEKFKTEIPIVVLNIGGIANVTIIEKKGSITTGLDIGPGNCLIDQWMKKNSNKSYDKDGSTAKSGSIHYLFLNKALSEWCDRLEDGDPFNKIKWYRSYDTSDFDLSFVRGLPLEDGAATLTEYTSEIYSNFINNIIGNPYPKKIIVCGGGRKNKFLIKSFAKKIKCSLDLIDKYGVNGDFVESQAFAYLAIRTYLKLPISFPETTGCNKPCTGGIIIENFKKE